MAEVLCGVGNVIVSVDSLRVSRPLKSFTVSGGVGENKTETSVSVGHVNDICRTGRG